MRAEGYGTVQLWTPREAPARRFYEAEGWRRGRAPAVAGGARAADRRLRQAAVRVYLGAFGDAGHAFPMLALGEALVARGHAVALQTWRNWEEHATAGGMTFAAAPEYQVFPTREQPLAPYAAAVRAARETVPSVRDVRRPTSSSPTSSPSPRRSPPSCAASRPRRSSRTSSPGPRPASRPTRSARGCRARGSARAPGARSTRSSRAGWSAGATSTTTAARGSGCRRSAGSTPRSRAS